MDEVPIYNLLQAIDPTKIKVPISERFAKLTLSSNKKQQQKCNGSEQQEDLKKLQQKRDSVTRNITKQFEEEDHENKPELKRNPLLRSESSKETEHNNSIDVADLTMEPLAVSDDDDSPTQVGDDMDLLSQKLASMIVESKAISLSSGSIDNLSVFSELVTSDSQRSSSTSDINNVRIIHNIPINIREAAKRETIALNLTPFTNDEFEKTYEMTDDGEEEDDDEEEEERLKEDVKAITLSDTSESSHDQEQDVMTTSTLPSTTLTAENLSLPSLIDNKAERVAAFLRDVSIEQRALKEQGQLDFHDTIDQILDNNEIDKIQATLEKSRHYATADTESMTPDAKDEATPKSVIDREKRLKALEADIEKEQIIQNICTENVTPTNRKVDQIMAKNPQRVADDDTLDNTVITEADQDFGEQRTPEAHYYPESPKKHSNAKSDKDVYKIANDETQCNTEYSISEDTRKIPNDNVKSCSTPKSLMNPCRLANEDTVSNTVKSKTEEEVLTHQYKLYNYYPDDEDLYNLYRNCSVVSIHSTSQSSAEPDSKQNSIGSVINSSNEMDGSAPEHSITILETDDENVQEENKENSDSKKLSNSFHKEDSSDDSDNNGKMSQIQMSMGSINISAKINIKIHIPLITSTDTSEDDQSYGPDNQDNKGSSKVSTNLPVVTSEGDKQEEKAVYNDSSSDSNEKDIEVISPQLSKNNEQFSDNNCISDANEQEITNSNCLQKPCNQMILKANIENITSSPNKSSDSLEVVEDEKFLTEAEKLLNQLYGKAWQTPEVIRSLTRNSQSSDKKTNNSSYKIGFKNSAERKLKNKSTVAESVLGDFSLFRQDIVKTNLDSTRVVTPKSSMHRKELFTEPKSRKPPVTLKEKSPAKPLSQTERKAVVRNRGRVNNDRGRQLFNGSNSEGDNASDDDDADISWSKNASELELDDTDSDYENSPIPKVRKRNNISRRHGRSDKSDHLTRTLNKSKEGEIVYLNLTKEEVEVEDEVPKSPPANHDVTFATRLQDILDSCRHKDQNKLPPSNKKTKRKLFTPNFGDDDYETPSLKDEAKSTRTINKTDKRYDLDEILEDNGNLPFDSQGRPKKFDLVNKQLESVKTGKPIFQLTPPSTGKNGSSSSNKKTQKDATSDSGSTPKNKSHNDAIFKTPLSVRAKVPPKTLRDLNQTPDYKYSFLKSLDVTVSKALCHPDALHYRDNYRTKKEELSQILYDMYNRKLFENKLNVPLKWNKKLLNTAGRCLNKKRLGTRSSVVELSDKVLTSADRLRCTLIHELCHAATWIFNGEGGHGSSWKEWARKANAVFPEIPKIVVCHQYNIEYKYTYKCTLCGAKSHAHSKSKKVENIRCSYCHGAIEILLNKRDKDGNVIPTPVKAATGFAKFVKDNYTKYKRDDLKHADVMKLLSNEFASLKVSTN